MVAVLAWGDIAYVEGDNFGNVPALALARRGNGSLEPTLGRFRAPASSRVVYRVTIRGSLDKGHG
jgi:hypothetical protein